jgi:hypothetical protein
MARKCGHKSAGKTRVDYNKKWLEYGVKVEMEHTCDKKKAERVAMDHLEESPFYYRELSKMEKKLDSMKKVVAKINRRHNGKKWRNR